MKTVLTIVLVLVIGLGVVCTAGAEFGKPEDAIEYRQAVMILLGRHFSEIGAVIKGQKPFDKAAVARNGALLDMLAPLSWEAFLVPGSDTGKTTMKSDVLKDPARFKADAAMFEAEMAKLAGATRSGDLEAIKAQFGNVAKSCKDCHGSFRSR